MCLCIFNLCSYILEKEIATHFSILAWKNPLDRGVWWATVHGAAELDGECTHRVAF